jgi:hypothetical protein
MMPGSELYKGNYIMKVVPRNLGINYTKTGIDHNQRGRLGPQGCLPDVDRPLGVIVDKIQSNIFPDMISWIYLQTYKHLKVKCIL